jgi:nucleosome binding factor SPN SPT16 subunit
VKGYLDSVGVIYSEGIVPINWNAVLEQIRSDFDDFLQNGAWRFLRTEDGDSEEDEDEL